MVLIEFLERWDVKSLVSSYNVIHIKGEGEYPSLFIVRFFDFLRNHFDSAFELIDVKELAIDVLQRKLETSFLGLSYVYWLKSFHELDDKNRKQWLSYIYAYKGPNIIMFYDENELTIGREMLLSVQLPSSIASDVMTRLLQAFKCKPSQSGILLLYRLFKRHRSITLDQSANLMLYISCISSSNDEHVDILLDRLIGTETSLFTLSTLFFAKQREPFFKAWSHMHTDYSDVFWITFWAEQVWRASFYISYASNRNMIEAKKISYRLPFSFIQKDWKTHSQAELIAAHQFLYSADHALKNGNESPILELFYIKFFQGSFKH